MARINRAREEGWNNLFGSGESEGGVVQARLLNFEFKFKAYQSQARSFRSNELSTTM